MEPEEPDAPDEPEAAAAADEPSPVFGAAQRLIESVIIAVATSTGLYLVGSVYTDSFFGRMSIDAASLDLSPPYIALQSTRVVQSLLVYPTTLLFFYLIYRMLSSRMPRLRSWYDWAHQRFGRLFLLIVNVLIVSPLLAAVIEAGLDEQVSLTGSILSEVAELMLAAGTMLLLYVIWLSFGPREVIISQIRERKLVPIVLIGLLYLLDALVATANGAMLDAELLMMGDSDSSITVEFTLAEGVPNTLPDTDLIWVITRNSSYYVVERQEYPPSGAPAAYAVPNASIKTVRMHRVNAADVELERFRELEVPPPVAE
jgi:hypothetical protein